MFERSAGRDVQVDAVLVGAAFAFVVGVIAQSSAFMTTAGVIAVGAAGIRFLIRVGGAARRPPPAARPAVVMSRR